MPTIFSHAIFASAIGSAFQSEKSRVVFWVLTATCAMLPDADVIGFAFAIHYESMFAHRGLTHSIAFALVIGLIVSTLFISKIDIPRWKLAMYFAAVTVSHPLLDMLTNGGLGVALLAPFSDERFFSPFRPIEVSPIGAGFFSERGLAVIASEIMWIWVPSILIVSISSLLLRKRS